MHRRLLIAALVFGAASDLAAQGATDPYVRIDSLHDALQPEAELTALKAVLAATPGEYQALWRAARAQVDIAKQIKGDHEFTRAVRDSVYAVARAYGEQAVAANPKDAEGHFVLALALGELSLTRGGKERVSYARQIYDATAEALALDSVHDGAEHVMGAWHAEIMRLSGVTRFAAKLLLGADFMGRAAWDSAAVHLERSVAFKPTYIHHRLELAQVYVDLGRYADARAQLEAIPALPTLDVLDGDHRAAAAALLDRIRTKADRKQ